MAKDRLFKCVHKLLLQKDIIGLDVRKARGNGTNPRLGLRSPQWRRDRWTGEDGVINWQCWIVKCYNSVSSTEGAAHRLLFPMSVNSNLCLYFCLGRNTWKGTSQNYNTTGFIDSLITYHSLQADEWVNEWSTDWIWRFIQLIRASYRLIAGQTGCNKRLNRSDITLLSLSETTPQRCCSVSDHDLWPLPVEEEQEREKISHWGFIARRHVSLSSHTDCLLFNVTSLTAGSHPSSLHSPSSPDLYFSISLEESRSWEYLFLIEPHKHTDVSFSRWTTPEPGNKWTQMGH